MCAADAEESLPRSGAMARRGSPVTAARHRPVRHRSGKGRAASLRHNGGTISVQRTCPLTVAPQRMKSYVNLDRCDQSRNLLL